MASSIRKQCGYTNDCKQAGVANCEGCSQIFCTTHFNDHRRSLDEEIEVLLSEYDSFTNTMVQEPICSNMHIFIQEIDDWENNSIKKIQQKAVELREELLKLKFVYIDKLSDNFQSLAEQIRKAREQADFLEPDLRCWKTKLDDLKSSLTSPSIINVNQHKDVPLVHNISISFIHKENHDLFDRVFNNKVEIGENGHIVTATQLFMSYTEIRGKYSYGSGCHAISFKVEHSTNQWAFLGINSKSTPLQETSFSSKSAYGWCNSNYIYSGGLNHSNKGNPPIEMNKNDIITLILDCDDRKISLINESTKRKYNLIVDVDNCPFPWQLHVIFRSPGARIRILSV